MSLFHFHDGFHQTAGFGNRLLLPMNTHLSSFELLGIIQVRLHRFVRAQNNERIVLALLVLDQKVRVVALLDPHESAFGGTGLGRTSPRWRRDSETADEQNSNGKR